MKRNYFVRSFISNIRFDEYYELYCELLGRADSRAYDEVHVNKLIDLLKSHLKSLGKVVERKRFHDNSTVIQDKVALRHRKLRALVKTADAMLDADTVEKREAALVLASFVRKEKRAFSRKRLAMQSGLSNRLAAALNEGDEMENALEALDLMGIVIEIVDLTSEIFDLSLQRDNENNYLSDLAEELRRKSYYHLTILLDTFEHLANIESENQEEYHEACLSMRRVLVTRNAAYQLRMGTPVDEEVEDDLSEFDSEEMGDNHETNQDYENSQDYEVTENEGEDDMENNKES